MSARTAQERASAGRSLRLSAHALLLLWAGFWSYFALGHLFSDGLAALPYTISWIAAMGGIVFLSWWRPTVGALALLAAAGFAALFFEGSGALTLLTLPALALAALYFAVAWRARQRA